MSKRALITGITGQDGSYLAELLLSKGYEVHGIVRHVALEDIEHRLWRIHHIVDRITLHAGSLESYASVFNIVEKVQPDECYHLAAQSFVSYSFEDEFSTVNANISGTMHVLSALKQRASDCKFYFAGSSEMFGLVSETPQTEKTPFHPRSPYGISKVAGFDFTRNYREAYGLFACSGMLFNHESPRRGFEFVTRKISNSVAQIALGKLKTLKIGNLDAKRDWGFAGDYVEAMWLMLQQEEPDDFVVGTGQTYSVRDFVESAFSSLGIEINWEGEGIDEKGRVVSTRSFNGGQVREGDLVVSLDPVFFRPSEVELLLANPEKAEKQLGWRPSVGFEGLVAMMVENDLTRPRKA
ncbi:MAG: GDP-mannose 4,6-dehydratase [Verrucomicrobiales bacterium]|nr:GDP-mannose 4,6-dehydratase [Verrucomicrobiales bacterium]